MRKDQDKAPLPVFVLCSKVSRCQIWPISLVGGGFESESETGGNS
jgi:hypothetical protein